MTTLSGDMNVLDVRVGKVATAATLQIVLVTTAGKLLSNGADYMGSEAKNVTKFIKESRPSVGDVVHLPMPGRAKVCAIIVAETQTEATLEALGEKITKLANSKDYTAVTLVIETFGLNADVVAAKLTYGMQFATNALSMKSDAKQDVLKKVYLYGEELTSNSAAATAAIEDATHNAMGSILMRTLIQLPPNVLGTRQLLAVAQGLKKYNKDVKVSVKVVKDGMNFGAMAAVGRVSNQDSLLIEIRYEGDANAPLTALVGKGLVFDTGGINLKSNGGTGMKGDMGGSAMVLGTMFSAILRKEKVNLIGVIGAVCNDIGPDAYRPDDVLTARNGTTIEVTNTDAEGRLVLADCLSYTEEKYSPVRMFSFATLTGAAVVAHGRRAPVFSDDDTFAADLVDSANAAGDMVAHVIMDDYLKPSLNSPIADTRNTSTGRMCGHTTAAIFLNKFVAKTPYMHVDIAGASDINSPGGGAFGVPMMLRYLTTYARG